MKENYCDIFLFFAQKIVKWKTNREEIKRRKYYFLFAERNKF